MSSQISPRGLWLLAVTSLAVLGLSAPPAVRADSADEEEREELSATITTPIFHQAVLQFAPDSAARFVQPGQTATDSGRVLISEIQLPEPLGPHRIRAFVTVQPIYKDDQTVYDRWDRAGNLRLVVDGRPDLELVRFITPYGGRAEYNFDVSDLGPLLHGRQSFRAFVDTWSSPGWKVDVLLRYEPDSTWDAPNWAAPVYYAESFDRKDMPNGADIKVDIPDGLKRVSLKILSTGHCTDGRDADEFVSKANVISVDGAVVARFHPWRTDCRDNRAVNPYTAHWKDGSWSSDYNRSGWCPGSEVRPIEYDLSDHLTPGKHTIHYQIEDIRPADAAGHFGYWRVSMVLVGWNHPPKLWQD